MKIRMNTDFFMTIKLRQFYNLYHIAIALVIGIKSNAQAIKIHEGPADKSGICEPSISIDPTNPLNIYAASILDNFYQSTDGGRSWTLGKISSSYGVWGDPCVITDQGGRIYYFHLSDPEGTNWRSDSILDRIVCQTKDGPNDSFNNGSFTAVNGKKHDKEWAAYDPATGRIGLSWTQFDRYGTEDRDCFSTILYSYSDDRGQTWSKPMDLSSLKGDCIDDDGTAEGAVPAFGLKGETYIGWALNKTIYISIIEKNGNLKTNSIARQRAGWTQNYAGFNRANGMPVTVVDHSYGPHRGRIYVCWGDKNKTFGGEIYVSYSDNNGKTWCDPIRISKGGNSHQFLPWLTVDPITGHLYAVYYDRRHTKSATETNVFMAYSHDSGKNWTEFKINEMSFHPSDKAFMGDYNHISAFDGVIRPIWTQLNEGKKSVWTYIHNEK